MRLSTVCLGGAVSLVLQEEDTPKQQYSLEQQVQRVADAEDGVVAEDLVLVGGEDRVDDHVAFLLVLRGGCGQ